MRFIFLSFLLSISTVLCNAAEVSPYFMTEYAYTENFDEVGTVKRSDNVPFKLKRIKGEAERFLYREGNTIKIREKMVDRLFERDFWTVSLELEVEKKIEQVSFCIVRDEFNTNGIVAEGGYWNERILRNSLQAFTKAMEIGCMGSLLEVKLSADGTLVACAENSPPLGEFLDVVTKQNNTILFCELKCEENSATEADRVVRAVLSEVKQRNAQEWLYYLTSDVEVLKALLRYEPEEFIVYINDDRSPSELKRMGCRMVAYTKELLRNKPLWIEDGRSAGVSITVRGVTEKDEMMFFRDKNVDNFITNRPDMIMNIVLGESRNKLSSLIPATHQRD